MAAALGLSRGCWEVAALVVGCGRELTPVGLADVLCAERQAQNNLDVLGLSPVGEGGDLSETGWLQGGHEAGRRAGWAAPASPLEDKA